MLWGRCYEEEGVPPYWPWVQAIRSYIREKDPEELRSVMGAGAEHIAEIVADVRERLPGLRTPPQVEPDQARFRLFDSITSFLKNAAQDKPLMLVLDDLQWADRSSLLLLEFLAREIGSSQLFLIGAYRDAELSPEHPLAQSLDALDRRGLLRRVNLRGHTRNDVARFIEVTAGLSPPEELVEAVYTQTEGNPLFITEVIRLLMQEGDLTAGSGAGLETWIGRIPKGVRDVIGRRLNSLSDECNDILTIATVSGREFEPSLIAPLVENTSEDRLREVLQEAMAALLIEELPRGRYQFTHALVREKFAEEMSQTRKAGLHATIGETLEEIYGDDVEPHAAELAHHFREAQTAVGKEKLVHYSLLAGDRALASYGYEDALDYSERGLVARDIDLSGPEPANDEEAAALLFGLARAKSATGVGHQLSEAFSALSRAFEYYTGAGSVAQAVAAAEFPIAPSPYRISGVAQLIARALAIVPADSHEAGRLLSRYGWILGAADRDYEGAQQALGRAIAIARREEDVPLEIQALTYAADVSGQHLHWQESVDNGLRAIELAASIETPQSELHSRYWTSISLLHMGDLNAARPHTTVMRDLAQSRRTPRELAGIGFAPITTLSCLEGDWEAGREYSDQGLEVSPLNPILLSPRVLLEHQTGESGQGKIYLERLLETMRLAGPDQSQASVRASMAIAAIARITGVSYRLEIAEAAAEAVLSNQSVAPLNVMYARAGLAFLAVQKGDQPAIEEQYSYFSSHQGTMIWTFASVDRLLGILSQAMGHLDQSAGHFQDALAFCRKAKYQPELAWTCFDYADSLRERRGEGDRAKAITLLDESLTISSDLGMRPLMERVLSRREILKA